MLLPKIPLVLSCPAISKESSVLSDIKIANVFPAGLAGDASAKLTSTSTLLPGKVTVIISLPSVVKSLLVVISILAVLLIITKLPDNASLISDGLIPSISYGTFVPSNKSVVVRLIVTPKPSSILAELVANEYVGVRLVSNISTVTGLAKGSFKLNVNV